MKKDNEKTNQTSRLSGVAIKLLFAWCYGLGFTQLFLPAADLPRLSLVQVLISVLFLALLALLTWSRRGLIVTGSFVLFMTLIVLAFRTAFIRIWQNNLPLLVDFLEWANNWLWGVKIEHESRPALLSLLFALGICLAAYLFIARFCRPFLPGLALIVLLVIVGNPLRDARFFWFFLCAVPSLAALARKQKHSWQMIGTKKYTAQASFMLQSLPVAVTGLLLTALLATQVSPAIFYSSNLANLLDDTGSIITSSIGVQRQFSSFSIAESGYYPLFDRLGGPVTLSDAPVMRVSGYPNSMLLRGNVAMGYDGQRWLRAADDAIFVFDSPININEQIRAFNLDLPESLSLSDMDGIFQENILYGITPAGNRLQTVFIEGRPLEIYMQNELRNQFYYNSSAQVLSRFWLTESDTVVVSARRILAGNRDFHRQVRHIQNQIPSEQAQQELAAVAGWLQLPDRAEYRADGDLALLVDRLTADRDGAWEKALGIRSFLFNHARYNLTVAVPPSDVDFVSWFLETREGYCVYFATAMTMLSRLAGIPARYVEGYYAPPGSGPDGARIITGEYAHAWTEIYLAGIGWVSIDATPGGIAVQPGEEVTPTPEPPVAITPQVPTPSPGEGRVPDLTPPVTPGRTQEDENIAVTSYIWIILLLAAAAAYILYSLSVLKKSHDQTFMRRKAAGRILALYYWKQIRRLMKYLGFSMPKNETVRDWLQRISIRSQWLAGRDELVSIMTTAIEKTYYSRSDPTEEEIGALAQAYDILEATARQNSNPVKYLFLRLLVFIWQQSRDLAG